MQPKPHILKAWKIGEKRVKDAALMAAMCWYFTEVPDKREFKRFKLI